jgi:hypothetical protein
MAGVLFDASAICAGFSIGFASALAAAKKPGGEGIWLQIVSKMKCQRLGSI